MSSIAKAIGALLILCGGLAAFFGVLGMITLVGFIPGFISWGLGTITLCIGLLIGWPKETRAWLVKYRAQQQARKKVMQLQVDSETQKILAAQKTEE